MYRNITKYIILLSITFTPLLAQPWNYNFGSSTGIYTTNAISTTFLPTPPSGGTLARVGSGSGSVNLENQIIPFGSGSYVRSAAATGTSPGSAGRGRGMMCGAACT